MGVKAAQTNFARSSFVVIALVAFAAGCPGADKRSANKKRAEKGGADNSSSMSTGSNPVPTHAVGWLGYWRGGACGKRKYARDLELRAEGVVRVHDRVSPCPPKVACVWSGIISFEGTWTLTGQRVTLKLRRITYPNMKIAPLPDALMWSTSLVAIESGVRCSYRRLRRRVSSSSPAGTANPSAKTTRPSSQPTCKSDIECAVCATRRRCRCVLSGVAGNDCGAPQDKCYVPPCQHHFASCWSQRCVLRVGVATPCTADSDCEVRDDDCRCDIFAALKSSPRSNACPGQGCGMRPAKHQYRARCNRKANRCVLERARLSDG